MKASRRNSKAKPLELAMFGSMKEMSSQVGIPISILTTAKEKGCTFVRHGRCDLLIFVKWFFSQAATSGDDERDWTKFDKKMTGLLKQVKLETAQHNVIEFFLVEHFIGKIVRDLVFGEIARMRTEFPSTLKGKSELEISKEMSSQEKRLKDAINKEFDIWLKKKGKI